MVIFFNRMIIFLYCFFQFCLNVRQGNILVMKKFKVVLFFQEGLIQGDQIIVEFLLIVSMVLCGYKLGELFRRIMFVRMVNLSWDKEEIQEDSQGNSWVLE